MNNDLLIKMTTSLEELKHLKEIDVWTNKDLNQLEMPKSWKTTGGMNNTFNIGKITSHKF